MKTLLVGKFGCIFKRVSGCQSPRSFHNTATATASPRQKSMCSSHRWRGPTIDGKERMNRLNGAILETSMYSGTRILEFTKENAGKLSQLLVSAVSSKLKDLQDNTSVESIVFVGDSTSFVDSFDAVEISNLDSKLEFMQKSHELSRRILSLNKNTIAVYSGKFNGTAYGLFSACKYRVGTPSTSFALTDLLQGTLPFGGVAFRLSNCSTQYGVEIGRYLAATCSSLEAIDMLQLGLLSHFSAEQVEDTISVSYQHTTSKYDDLKCYQPLPVRSESIEELLEDTNICCNVDPLDDQIFDQMMLVHPKENEVAANGVWEGTLMKDIDGIYTAFSAESVREAKHRLGDMETKWSLSTLNRMEMIDEHLLQKWFELTKYAATSNCTLDDVYEKERLLSQQLQC